MGGSGAAGELESVAVREVDARGVDSEERLRALLAEGPPDEPVLLRGAPFSRDAARFTVAGLVLDAGQLRLPRTAPAAREVPGAAAGCSLFIAAQARGEEVLGAAPARWQPDGCSLGSVLEGLARGSGHYLTTRSGKRACRRTAAPQDELTYEDDADPAGYDVIVKALVPKVPFPLALPRDKGFRITFWMGAMGNNFGLHTDLFTEQFLVQHEGVKEVFLLLPEDASVVAPFPFLSSPLWYKSERRSVQRLDLRGERCLRAELRPGDVLFMPPWWWHEVRTVSPGPSLSTTFRFHTEDADRLSRVMNDVYFLHRHAQELPCGRLARHLRSFLLHGLLHTEAAAGRPEGGAGACAGCACGAAPRAPRYAWWAGAVAAFTVAFLVGRRLPAS